MQINVALMNERNDSRRESGRRLMFLSCTEDTTHAQRVVESWV